MADILQKPDRELNMWPMSHYDVSSSHGPDLKIIELANQYLVSEPIEVQIEIHDSSFICGDLYITIYDISTSEKQVLTQSGFLKQCFIQNNNILYHLTSNHHSMNLLDQNHIQ